MGGNPDHKRSTSDSAPHTTKAADVNYFIGTAKRDDSW